MIFSYKDKIYPSYIKNGNACSYIQEFAKQFCVGNGLDIGGTSEWSLPNTRSINIDKDDGYHATNLPSEKYDFIFSSHTLEHTENYIDALLCWKDHLRSNGTLFLYLPHPDMEYWLPQNNRKHKHIFYPKDIIKTLKDIGFVNVINSERDLYWSFSVIGFKE
jgi:SAM-dependent methyltransferase